MSGLPRRNFLKLLGVGTFGTLLIPDTAIRLYQHLPHEVPTGGWAFVRRVVQGHGQINWSLHRSMGSGPLLAFPVPPQRFCRWCATPELEIVFPRARVYDVTMHPDGVELYAQTPEGRGVWQVDHFDEDGWGAIPDLPCAWMSMQPGIDTGPSNGDFTAWYRDA